jgi:thiamine-phosphate pyrophosphorylase
MFRYAITNRSLFPGNEAQRQAALIQQTARWAADGIDLIQLREKDLPTGTLVNLARKILQTISLSESPPSRLLINARLDVAIAARAHGVHLTAAPGELTAAQVRSLYLAAGLPPPIITVSCHTLAEVERATRAQADAIVFAPVFEKPLPDQAALPGSGLDQLRSACAAAHPTWVYALGGVTQANAPACLAAGASGIAGIRLFHTS